MNTEASYRFERGTDYHGLVRALDECARLTAEFGGGTVLRGRVDVEAVPPGGVSPGDPLRVPLRRSRLNMVLGVAVPAEEAELILGNLGFRCEPSGYDGWMVEIPSYRPDVRIEADLIEEVARVYGYDRIPATLAVGAPVTEGVNRRLAFEALVREALTGFGYSEALTDSFEGDRALERLGIPEGDSLRNLIRILNPLSAEESGMRTSLVPSILGELSLNARRGNRSAALFELARVYLRETNEDLTRCEKPVVSGGAYGPKDLNWTGPKEERDFFDVKGLVEGLLRALGIEGEEYAPEAVPFLHPGRSAAVMLGGKRAGILGELDPQLADGFEIRGRVVLYELDAEVLEAAAKFEAETLSPLSSFPPAMRDIAVVAGSDVPADRMMNVIRETAGDILESLWLFDVYEGEPLAEGERSLAFRLLYRSRKDTLTDDRVNQIQNRIVKRLEKELGARLRE